MREMRAERVTVMRAPKKTSPMRLPPGIVYVVWCDGAWVAFTTKRAARYWCEDGHIWVFQQPSGPLEKRLLK